MGWVRLHPYNISQTVQVVVEHFRERVAPLLSGRAKAMVVVASRVEAVRWKIAIDAYIKERGYRIGTLVANAELLNAIMGALDAHTGMSTQALNSPEMQRGLKDILLNHAGLFEALRVAKSSATS